MAKGILRYGGKEIMDEDGVYDLSGLSIRNITDIHGLEDIGFPKKLDLSNNEISEIKGLEKCVGLTRLDMSHNNISRIEGLERLMNLAGLILDHNKIDRMEYVSPVSRDQHLDHVLVFTLLYAKTHLLKQCRHLNLVKVKTEKLVRVIHVKLHV